MSHPQKSHNNEVVTEKIDSIKTQTPHATPNDRNQRSFISMLNSLQAKLDKDDIFDSKILLIFCFHY